MESMIPYFQKQIRPGIRPGSCNRSTPPAPQPEDFLPGTEYRYARPLGTRHLRINQNILELFRTAGEPQTVSRTPLTHSHRTR